MVYLLPAVVLAVKEHRLEPIQDQALFEGAQAWRVPQEGGAGRFFGHWLD